VATIHSGPNRSIHFPLRTQITGDDGIDCGSLDCLIVTLVHCQLTVMRLINDDQGKVTSPYVLLLLLTLAVTVRLLLMMSL
jgi:hypothetical protein